MVALLSDLITDHDQFQYVTLHNCNNVSPIYYDGYVNQQLLRLRCLCSLTPIIEIVIPRLRESESVFTAVCAQFVISCHMEARFGFY